MKNDLPAKIERHQTYITTLMDLSGFGYSKQGRSSAGIPVWITKEVQISQDNRSNPINFRRGDKNCSGSVERPIRGIRKEKNIIRMGHNRKWRQYKHIIAPGSQIHHEWIPGIPDYRGVALVEADQHMSGIIEVIEVMGGEITMSTEVEVRGGVK